MPNEDRVFNVFTQKGTGAQVVIEACCCGHRFTDHVADLDAALSRCELCNCVWFHEPERHDVYIREAHGEHERSQVSN